MSATAAGWGIRSGVCPYCGADYRVSAGGCVARCLDSRLLALYIQTAALAGETIDADVLEAAAVEARQQTDVRDDWQSGGDYQD